MMPLEIAPKIYDVGVVDWAVRDFHGYKTERGASYNSYLIMDEKICLIDTVKAMFAEELLAKIERVVDPGKIDYVIVNHVEPDHAGALPALVKAAPNAKFFITAQGKAEAIRHYGDLYDFQVVKDGDKLSLGKRELTFVTLPMLHWPDSMATYCADDGILFSNDAFGQHYCTSKRFDDEIDEAILFFEAQKYFANILSPYAKLVEKALQKIEGLPLRMIAPSHGAVWRSHIDKIIEKYSCWGAGAKNDTLIIAYETMWGGTVSVARSVLTGAASAGIPVKLFRLNSSDNSHIVAELLEAGGVLFGSPTLNYGMMPAMGGLLTYLKGLKPGKKLAAAFGTYGWSGGAQKDMEEFLAKAGFELQPGFNCKWKPQSTETNDAEKFGYEFAMRLKE